MLCVWPFPNFFLAFFISSSILAIARPTPANAERSANIGMNDRNPAALDANDLSRDTLIFIWSPVCLISALGARYVNKGDLSIIDFNELSRKSWHSRDFCRHR